MGIEDKKYAGERIRPFIEPESANALISVLLEQTTPAVDSLIVEFITIKSGFLLHISIPKSPKVHYTASGDCFIRLNAGKQKIKGERVTALAYSKGSLLYEKVPVATVSLKEIEESKHLIDYMQRVATSIPAESFLRKQRLVAENSNGTNVPNVGCVLLFDEEPQASIDTRCAIKVYRLRTTDTEYKREHLAEMPATINGPLESVIRQSIEKIKALVNGASFYDGENLVKMQYPADAIQEVLVNAVIHRDYSLNDDIHVKIFDNRIEITSPGKLPGYMNTDNIYDERFSRNPNIVRMLHNLPNPLNHDIGEGLDTVKNELKKAGLVAPVFEERGNAFVVTMKHQRIASVEDVVMGYLSENPDSLMTNKLARQLSGEDDINKVKKALQKLRADKKLALVDDNAKTFNYQYKKI
ncbi:ATP-binding protein [Stutzerimonas nitrititolerans]|uniref:ATP-binding protein n=1 Tax=Stutzerimonas nitrititolerans TaxID=2482751 RepID=UPI0028B04B26|nr:ATP-binding protein [Stutzerimonas nitrititolerans]